MARGRMIYKEISESKSFAKLNDSNAQLLVCLLTSWWDDHGKMIGEEEWIKGNIVRKLPQFSLYEIGRCLCIIHREKIVIWWMDDDGNKWLYWPEFGQHQTISEGKKCKDSLPTPKNPQKSPAEFWGRNNHEQPIANSFTPQKSPRKPWEIPAQEEEEVEVKEEEEVEVKEEEEVEVKEEVEGEAEETPLPPNPAPETSVSVSQSDINDVREICKLNFIENIPEDDEVIQAAINEYTKPWVVAAVKEACGQNELSWYYVLGVLRNCKAEGHSPGAARSAPTSSCAGCTHRRNRKGHPESCAVGHFPPAKCEDYTPSRVQKVHQ